MRGNRRQMHYEVTELKTSHRNALSAQCDCCVQRQHVVGRMNSPTLATFVIDLYGMLAVAQCQLSCNGPVGTLRNCK